MTDQTFDTFKNVAAGILAETLLNIASHDAFLRVIPQGDFNRLLNAVNRENLFRNKPQERPQPVESVDISPQAQLARLQSQYGTDGTLRIGEYTAESIASTGRDNTLEFGTATPVDTRPLGKVVKDYGDQASIGPYRSPLEALANILSEQPSVSDLAEMVETLRTHVESRSHEADFQKPLPKKKDQLTHLGLSWDADNPTEYIVVVPDESMKPVIRSTIQNYLHQNGAAGAYEDDDTTYLYVSSPQGDKAIVTFRNVTKDTRFELGTTLANFEKWYAGSRPNNVPTALS